MRPNGTDVRVLRFFFLLALIGANSGIESNALAQASNARVGAALDPLHALQNRYVDEKNENQPRLYHFGAQGPAGVFSNHRSHTNRFVPVYLFGSKGQLSEVMGERSTYRDADKIRALYGRLPDKTLNPDADYADQSDLHRVQKAAVDRGVKHLFVVWFDGLDWDTVRAAALYKSGQVYDSGPGHGLIFQDYSGTSTPQFGYVVTAPTHDDPSEKQVDVSKQSLADISGVLGGGFDVRFVGPNPWTPGPLLGAGPGYLKGQAMTKEEAAAVASAGGIVHAYTDSASSACEMASGVKTFNGSINFRDDGTAVTTLFQDLQGQGWKVGTVTSVPFCHASPAAMYAHNVSRDDYQDLGREMLGLPAITQNVGKVPALPGLDVVIGCGWGVRASDSDLKKQGDNAVAGNQYLTANDLRAIDARNGGQYEVALRTAGVEGTQVLDEAAESAAQSGRRLFGFFGTRAGHLPFRTADGDYRPAKGIRGYAERYTPEDLRENPSLREMTRAALRVITVEKKPFALFVEAGDVDFGLHDNNLDAAIGAVYDGEEAIREIISWVEQNSNWDESLMLVTGDHGHYLVIDDPEGIARLGGNDRKKLSSSR